MKDRQEKLNEVLMRVAKGCRVEEVTEEYAEVDGQMRLTKRKEIRRDIPPDLKAVQMLLGGTDDVGGWTDEQLEEERERLLKALEKSKKRGKPIKKEKKDEGKIDGNGGAVADGKGRGKA